MDRDKRWERICIAYDAMIAGDGEECTEDKVAVGFSCLRLPYRL